MRRNKDKTRNWLIVSWIIMTIVLVMAGPVDAKITHYSAEQVSLTPSGAVEHQGMLYVTPDTVRMEIRSPDGKGTMLMIMRKDLDLYWMLNPTGKKYFERPLKEEEWEQTVRGMVKSKVEKNLGTEKVNGFKCTKKEVETVVEILGFKKKSRSTVWISKKLDMPLRTQSEGGNITELRNIKEGKQPTRLFKIPDGYQKVGNIMTLFAGSDEEEAEEGSGGFSLPKDLGDKLKGLKLPFGK